MCVCVCVCKYAFNGGHTETKIHNETVDIHDCQNLQSVANRIGMPLKKKKVPTKFQLIRKGRGIVRG